MRERCQVCGKEILEWHEGFSASWIYDAPNNVTVMGGVSAVHAVDYAAPSALRMEPAGLS